MRGRKRIPTALRVLRGTVRGMNREEPQPDPLGTVCPDVLTGDVVARAEWDRGIVPAIRTGHLTSADRVLAILHCALWSQWQAQAAEANKRPHVVRAGASKYPIPNPARGMANATLKILANVDEKLGFSPTSRAKVEIRPPLQESAIKREAARRRFFDGARG